MKNTSHVPQALADVIAARLGASLVEAQALAGGSISRVARCHIAGQPYLLKWHEHPPQPAAGWPGMFEAEARGLELLAQTEILRVPSVLAYADADASCPAYILLEWVASGEAAVSLLAAEALGRQLAILHRVSSPLYGLEHNNYCGTTPQDNRPLPRWSDFYAERRLGF